MFNCTSTILQINGNENGYRASMTQLNIYNVRHIKIRSTDRERVNFCLRLEFCGVGRLIENNSFANC